MGGWHLGVKPVNPADQADKRNAVLGLVKTDVPKILSYTPENVESVLTDAISLTTGQFRDSYGKFIHEVVIPGAQEKRISAVATVPAAGIESLTDAKATALAFVNTTITAGDEQPVNRASSVRIGLVKIDDKWLIEAFVPV